MLKVLTIEKGGLGKKFGFRKGDELVSFNGQPIVDVLDYFFFDGECEFTVTRRRHGKEKEILVVKEDYETLGLCFTEEAELSPITCQNKCVFCFVDQLPNGMRDTLYVKDDDYRLSFVSGNYVTLTNCSDAEIRRIAERHLSPIFISVHTTDPELRCQMMNNRFAGKLMEQMQTLAEAEITMHCQVVMCPKINDGEVLKKTIEDLISLYPFVASLAIVPVGLTGHRDGLCKIEPVSSELAAQTIDLVESFATKMRKKHGHGFVYCSDEFYVKAKRAIPPANEYDGYPQIENGVGLLRKFEEEFSEAFEEEKSVETDKVAILCGASARSFFEELTKPFENVSVFAVENNFFGKSITVTGLITGQDLISQVPEGFDRVLISRAMLKEDAEVFLDGVALEEANKKIYATLEVVPVDGAEFYAALTGRSSYES